MPDRIYVKTKKRKLAGLNNKVHASHSYTKMYKYTIEIMENRIYANATI